MSTLLLASITEQLTEARKQVNSYAALAQYYREFVPDITDCTIAPPGYFTYQTSDEKWIAGYVTMGSLHVLQEQVDTEEEAIKITWDNYHTLVGEVF